MQVLPPQLKLTPLLHLEFTSHTPQTVSHLEAPMYVYHVRTNLRTNLPSVGKQTTHGNLCGWSMSTLAILFIDD